MATLQETILATIEAANGEETFENIVNAVEYPQRQKVLATIRGMEQSGQVKRNLSLNKATGIATLTVSKVGA